MQSQAFDVIPQPKACSCVVQAKSDHTDDAIR